MYLDFLYPAFVLGLSLPAAAAAKPKNAILLSQVRIIPPVAPPSALR